MKDPFEAACEEQEQESPPESPIQGDDDDVPASAADAIDDQEAPGLHPVDEQQQPEAEDDEAAATAPSSSSAPVRSAAVAAITARKGKDEDDQEEEEENINMPRKLPSGADPDKMAKMQAILSQFTEEQMSRYESFRRSGFQKSNMKKLLASIIGSQKISVPMTIVVSGIAKMFVGELVETGRTVMMERKETGPLRPCHIREAYRRLKLEGKVPRRSVPRLFR